MQELDQTVTIGATVPTGFEHTAAEEVQEKLEATARVSKNRGRIYFDITTDKLLKVSHTLVSRNLAFCNDNEALKSNVCLTLLAWHIRTEAIGTCR